MCVCFCFPFFLFSPQLLEPRTGSTNANSSLQPNNGNQQWWERPSDHRGWWPSQKRGQADMSWWTGEQYRGQSTTNVLRSYDADGVGTTTRDSSNNRYGNNTFGSSRALRGVASTNTTWDTMGRGLSRRPYDDVDRSNTYGSGGQNSIMSNSMSSSLGGSRGNRSTNDIGRYSGLRASGGATRFR